MVREGVREMKTPQDLATEHWEFLEKWMGMAYEEAFIHGDKHGYARRVQEEKEEEKCYSGKDIK